MLTYNPGMRLAPVLLVLAVATASIGAAFTVPTVGRLVGLEQARADGDTTLYISGLDIGPKKQVIVRLRNTSTHASDVLSVHYTVRDPSAGVPLSQPGAGNGAQLRPGDTLELDLGAIVNAFRAEREVSGWNGPVHFVAFGTGGNFGDFGPETVQVEAVQTVGRARFTAAVEWIED